MRNPFLNLVNALFPLLIAFVSIAVVCSPFRLFTKTRVEFSLPLYNILVPIGVSGEFVANGSLCLITLLSILHFFFRDYAFMFPRYVNYDVYYDKEGLSGKISKLQLVLRKQLPIPEEWDAMRQETFCWIDSKLAAAGMHGDFFSRPKAEQYITSKGKAEHVMKLQRHWQKYRLTEINGTILHTLYFPGIEPQEIQTHYQLLESSRNTLRLKLRDFLTGCYVAMPRMAQQLFRLDSHKIYDAEIVGITFIRIFPLSMLEYSVFCMEKDDILVPIAYAEYE